MRETTVHEATLTRNAVHVEGDGNRAAIHVAGPSAGPFAGDLIIRIYAHMNINYLALARMPASDDWSLVWDALRRGDFFTTTGEVIVHVFDVRDGGVMADREWTFPLSHLLLPSWDGREVTRRTIAVPDVREFERRTFDLPIEGTPRWVRLEAWDIATNGAFTQPRWR